MCVNKGVDGVSSLADGDGAEKTGLIRVVPTKGWLSTVAR